MKQFNYKEIEKITTTPITKDLFDIGEYDNVPIVTNGMGEPILDTDSFWNKIIDNCELLRKKYLETKERKYFNTLILLLPNSYNLVNLRPSPKYVKKAVKKWSDKTHYYNEYNKEHYEKYKARVKEYSQQEDVKERRRIWYKQYYQLNKDKILARQRKARKEHSDRYKQYQKEHYQKHREEILKRQREKRSK